MEPINHELYVFLLQYHRIRYVILLKKELDICTQKKKKKKNQIFNSIIL